ncbi:MAG: helix-turn-helix domain-containing protein [Bacteroidota bacterium]
MQKSIAVLPFVNLSADKSNEYLSDGMTEEIINALTRVKGLKVTSRTSSFHFKNTKLAIPEIGEALNVSIILEGSIRLANNKMRITAQLIDVQEDFHFWSENFERELDDIFVLQDEISLIIADRLREHLGHFDIEDQLVNKPDISITAYQNYLKARYHILKMGPYDIKEGIIILNEIIEQHPSYPLAYLGLHLGYTLLGTIGYLPAAECFAKGKPFLEKAIQLDDSLPECQLQKAWLSFLEDWDFETTYAHLSKAFEIRPFVDYYQTMASTLVAEGKTKAAMHYIDIAIQMDPFSAVNHHLKGYIYYTAEVYDQAIHWFEKSLSIDTNSHISLLYLGQAFILTGYPEKSLALFESLDDEKTDTLLKLGGKTLSYAALGEIEKVEQGVTFMKSELTTDRIERAMNLLILCFVVLENFEAAIELIEKGKTIRLPLMIYLPVEPLLKPLRRNATFKAFSQKILGSKSNDSIPERRYKKALFEKSELEAHKLRLIEIMEQEQPYLDAKITLRSLAEIMNLPANRLSQLLNEGFSKNFSTFINTYRLEAFKAMAKQPEFQHLSILGLAYESGFNSKTVFNTFFRKQMGMTPKVFWNTHIRG